MKIKLKAFAEESNDIGKYYRFAVIDTEKSCEYFEFCLPASYSY